MSFRRFTTKTLIYASLLTAAIVVLHEVMRSAYLVATVPAPGTICVWGDSRTYRGIDLPALAAETGRPTLSSAVHGGGCLDLAVFAESVPDRSDVVLGFSLPMFIRAPDRDYQRSGLSLHAVLTAHRYGWDWSMLAWIGFANRDPLRDERSTQFPAYPALASRADFGLDRFHELLRRRRREPYYAPRMEFYRSTALGLLSRGCRVLIVEFPVAPEIRAMRDESPYADYLSDLEPLFRAGATLLADIRVPEQPNSFYDVSHVNERGRAVVTHAVARELERLGWTRRR